MTRRLTDLQLERFNADALSPAEKAAVEAVLAQSADDTEALRLLKADDAAYFLSNPPAAFVAKVAPAPKKQRSWLASLMTFGAVAAAMVALLVWRGGFLDEPDYGVKGDVAWRVTAADRVLQPGGVLHEGDVLSFQVTTGQPRWVAVISHAPDGWFVYSAAERVEEGESLLKTGAKLDATKGDETLYLVSAPEPFDAEGVKVALSGGLDGHVAVEELKLQKQ